MQLTDMPFWYLVLQCLYYSFGNCIPLFHFTDQTAEATISKFGSGLLYSIRVKMGIIKRVLIKALI